MGCNSAILILLNAARLSTLFMIARKLLTVTPGSLRSKSWAVRCFPASLSSSPVPPPAVWEEEGKGGGERLRERRAISKTDKEARALREGGRRQRSGEKKIYICPSFYQIHDQRHTTAFFTSTGALPALRALICVRKDGEREGKRCEKVQSV